MGQDSRSNDIVERLCGDICSLLKCIQKVLQFNRRRKWFGRWEMIRMFI